MKDDKKILNPTNSKEILNLETVAAPTTPDNIFKSMSLNDLLAALELIMEFEKVNKEFHNGEERSRKFKYLH